MHLPLLHEKVLHALLLLPLLHEKVLRALLNLPLLHEKVLRALLNLPLLHGKVLHALLNLPLLLEEEAKLEATAEVAALRPLRLGVGGGLEVRPGMMLEDFTAQRLAVDVRINLGGSDFLMS